MTREELLSRLVNIRACFAARDWVTETTGTPEELWSTCPYGDWLLWLAAAAGADKRLVVLAACDCAETSTPHLPAATRWAAGAALAAARRWARGEATEVEVRAAVDQAFDVEETAYPVGAAASATRAAIQAARGVTHVVCASAAADSAADSAALAAAALGAPHFTASYMAIYSSALPPASLRCADLVRARIPWADVEAALLRGAS